MRGLASFLLACACWCFTSTLATAAERSIAHHQGLTASVDSGFGCARSASITVRAPEASAYTGDRIALQRLLGAARAGLGANCPILNEIDITGFADGDPAFRATITADDGWRLPTGIGRIRAENPLSPLARETARCDYERSDPFVGCWITIEPETSRGTILNIRNDGTWYWDTPEKLALGESSLDGKEIKHDYMYLAGPYMTFIQKNGLGANMIGPYFGWDCNIMKINPYDPGGLATMMGASYGLDAPHRFVRLHSPQWINGNILKPDDIDPTDGYLGNPGNDEIVESLPDDGPLFNNCVDNFNDDFTDEMMLDAALITISAFRLPLIASERLLERLYNIAIRNPAKYRELIKAIVERLAILRGKSLLRIANRGSTGRTEAANLVEQLAMQEVKSDPLSGTPLPGVLIDSRWPATEGWIKYAKNINGVEIHYNVNRVLRLVDDFKFK